MAVTYKTLVPSKQAESTQTVQYTASGTRAVIDKCTATNTSASVVTISFNLIQSLGVAGDGNLITKQRSIYPSETYVFNELSGHVLQDGDSISTIASAPSSLTIRISGREIV